MEEENNKPTTNISEEKESKVEAQEPLKEEKSPIKLITIVVLSICVGMFIWYILSNRHTPYTDQSRLNALVIPIVPKISGYLNEINVRLHSKVKKGDLLFQIDPKSYQIDLRQAETTIEKATQQMGYQGAGVKSAAGRLGMAKAQLDRAQRNYDRVQVVYKENPDALSLSDRDAAETTLASAIEQVSSAEADLEKAQQQLGEFGPDNANLKSAITKVETATLNLSYTTITAPTNGIIESFNLDIGYYASAGQPLVTFISTSDTWIQADFAENSIENISVNDKVDFILDIAPGRVFEGKVRSIGFGVLSDQPLNRGQLPDIQSKQGWLRDPQRFPVIISFDNKEVMKYFKLGGQADVVIYTSNNAILNGLAKFRIWMNSKLSYVR